MPDEGVTSSGELSDVVMVISQAITLDGSSRCEIVLRTGPMCMWLHMSWGER